MGPMWTIRSLAAVMAIVSALLIVACGSEGTASSGSDEPQVTATPSVLSERVALRTALERKGGGIYSEMVGEPTAVWGATMTYGEAAELMGSPINPDTSECDNRDDPVWYFVLEGRVVTSLTSAPGPTAVPDLIAKPSVVGMAFNAFTGSARFGTSAPAPRDLGVLPT